MRAADAIEDLPTVSPDDDALSAVLMVARQRLPGLIVADPEGVVVSCVSSIDLLQAALPRYLREEPNLARVFDEKHADRIAAALIGARVGDVVRDMADRVPVARPRATVVELAELMVQRCCPLVLVAEKNGPHLGVVTANGLLALLAAKPRDHRDDP
jgi:CBS-domain-containing membrane protein